jgi:hypothetical protein
MLLLSPQPNFTVPRSLHVIYLLSHSSYLSKIQQNSGSPYLYLTYSRNQIRSLPRQDKRSITSEARSTTSNSSADLHLPNTKLPSTSTKLPQNGFDIQPTILIEIRCLWFSLILETSFGASHRSRIKRGVWYYELAVTHDLSTYLKTIFVYSPIMGRDKDN